MSDQISSKPVQHRSVIVRAACIVGLLLVSAAALFGGDILYAVYGFGPADVFTNPSHDPVTLGNGPRLKYVVIGDSTAAGRGAPYDDGIAMATARHLALTHRVTMVNLAISGATFSDVITRELADAVQLKPDIVLLACGANDATHFTPSDKVTAQVSQIIAALRINGRRPVVVATGCPEMGSVTRFAQPLRWLAGVQTARMNRAIGMALHGVTLAPVVDTGPAFVADPSLFAADHFHPNSRGYATWIPIINRALDEAMSLTKSQ